MKKFLFFEIILFAAVNIFAQNVSGDFEWDVNGSNNILVFGYLGEGGEVTIPEQFGGKRVTQIYEMTFMEKKITSVTLPNSVISIGSSAFSDNELTNLIIPASVMEINHGAFFRNRLTSVTIPAKVVFIGNNAFNENPLISITIGANVDLAGEEKSEAFDKGHFGKLYYSNGRLAGTYTRENADSTNWMRH